MMPAGPLMIEHRLIERMIALLKKELQSIKAREKVDLSFTDNLIDFIKTYADRTHHGKEEDILFKNLEGKTISGDHEKIMKELIEDHRYGRKLTPDLLEARDKYESGFTSAVFDLIEIMKKLADFYPRHIEKEDKHFFIPAMEYFSRQEQDRILEEFWEFDKKMIHEKYTRIVESHEKS